MASSAAPVFIVAGEPSGDLIGARLMRALHRRSPVPLRFIGIGGRMMQEEGLESLFPLSDLAVMGIGEVVPRLPLILRRLREATSAAVEARPVAVITIDSSSFNKRLARRLRAAGLRAPRIHYVAPMVWAWRPGRARATAEAFDHLITLFQFEPDSFRAAGLDATWAGHPAVEKQPGDGAEFRRRHGIAPSAKVVSVLPGSRDMEVARLLPIFREALKRLPAPAGGLHTVIPTVESVAVQVRAAAKVWPTAVTVVESGAEKTSCFAASDVGLAASGTVTLELAVSEVPMVVAYRATALTAFLARRLLQVRYVSLVNILAEGPIVPELLQEDCTPDRLAGELSRLLTDAAARERQLASFRSLRGMLAPTDSLLPSERAADLVLSLAFPCEAPQSRPDFQ